MGVNINRNFNKDNKIYDGFMKFVIFSLAILFIIILNATISNLEELKSKFSILDVYLLLLFLVIISGIYIAYKKNISSKIALLLIILVGLILRTGYAFTIESQPISDFSVIYETAYEVLNGNYSNLWGTGYIARFPHITVPVFYFAGLIKMFDNPLEAARLINVIASTTNIILTYLIVKEVFNSKLKGQIAALLMALYPPMILYTAVFTTENQAVPLFLLSIYLFILFIKGKMGYWCLVFSGISLSVGNLLRMVAPIIIVAYIMYLILCNRATIKNKVISSVVIVVAFIVPLISTSMFLHTTGVMEYQLWKGREPAITSILKGTNIEYKGRWNPDDAAIPEKFKFDYDAIDKECKRIIWERLTTTPFNESFKFYINKFAGQWSVGDFSGAYWAEHGLNENQIRFKISNNGIVFAQSFHLLLLLLIYIGFMNIRFIKENREISLFYFMFCGYGMFYLVSETQARYSFVVCWLFVILALVGVDLIMKLKRKGENHGKG